MDPPLADELHTAIDEARSAGEALAEAAEGPSQPVTHSKWYRWRKDGTALIAYLLDSEVHTFAFSVAANAILSFIPFVILLYTLALRVFRSQAMVGVVDDMVNYFLPSVTKTPNWLANSGIINTPRDPGAFTGNDSRFLHGDLFAA